jgi:Protein of unknown function (DUF3618)
VSTTDRSSTVDAPIADAQALRAQDGRPRRPQEIEAEIVEARQNLASTLDQLADRTNPKNVAKRGVAKARGVVQHPDGSIKPKPVAIIAGVVLLLVVYRIRKSRLD